MPKTPTPGSGFDAYLASLPWTPTPEMVEHLRAAHEDGARTVTNIVSEGMRRSIVSMSSAVAALGEAGRALTRTSSELSGLAEKTAKHATVAPGAN